MKSIALIPLLPLSLLAAETSNAAAAKLGGGKTIAKPSATAWLLLVRGS